MRQEPRSIHSPGNRIIWHTKLATKQKSVWKQKSKPKPKSRHLHVLSWAVLPAFLSLIRRQFNHKTWPAICFQVHLESGGYFNRSHPLTPIPPPGSPPPSQGTIQRAASEAAINEAPCCSALMSSFPAFRGLCRPLEAKPLPVTLSVPSFRDPPCRSALLWTQGRVMLSREGGLRRMNQRCHVINFWLVWKLFSFNETWKGKLSWCCKKIQRRISSMTVTMSPGSQPEMTLFTGHPWRDDAFTYFL